MVSTDTSVADDNDDALYPEQRRRTGHGCAVSPLVTWVPAQQMTRWRKAAPTAAGLVGALVHATARSLAGREPGRGRGAPGETVERLDVERMARAIVDRYPAASYPAVVLGSPHGSAAHLAVALGAPWLPAAFDVSATEPVGLCLPGAATAARIVVANPGVTARQVDTPGLAGVPGRPVTVFVRWKELPAAYARFLAERLVPGGAVLLARDSETWTGGFGAQAVNPEFVESLRHWLTGRDHPLYRVMFSRPEVLSAAVADLYRQWLRGAGKTGDRLVVECGRLLDPGQVIRAGLVPYWLPGPGRHAVRELHWWLAGSQPFTQIDVLVEPPGAPRDDLAGGELAGPLDFAAAAGFAWTRGVVDERGLREYPHGRVSPERAGEVLRRLPYDLPAPPRLEVPEAVAMLGETTEVSAMIVH
jgi:hypothetical protein